MSTHYETCARCDKDLVITMSDDYYFSDIDGKVLCKECYEKEQPKELIKQIADLQSQLAEKEKEIAYKLKQQNQKAIEHLEKVKELLLEKCGETYSKTYCGIDEDIEEIIGNQINELKGKVEDERN